MVAWIIRGYAPRSRGHDPRTDGRAQDGVLAPAGGVTVVANCKRAGSSPTRKACPGEGRGNGREDRRGLERADRRGGRWPACAGHPGLPLRRRGARGGQAAGAAGPFAGR
jgi:hypothetical protein